MRRGRTEHRRLRDRHEPGAPASGRSTQPTRFPFEDERVSIPKGAALAVTCLPNFGPAEA